MSHTCGQNCLASNIVELCEKIRYQYRRAIISGACTDLVASKETTDDPLTRQVRKQIIGNMIVGPCYLRIFARRTRSLKQKIRMYIPDIWFNTCNLWDQMYVYACIRDQSPSTGSLNVSVSAKHITMQTSRIQ
jgi:hypothetical protein